MRVKICGITRPEDAVAAARAGADAIGLVFYAASPRAVSRAQAQSILSALPASVSSVGLFVNAAADDITDILRDCPLDLIQFHGDETDAECATISRPYIKAIRVRDAAGLTAQIGQYPGARALLLDAYHKDLAGGTGQTFDWSMIPENMEKPLILAGGLNPDNVRSAIEQVRPYAVDVSGGVELAKGIKDPDRIKSFINEVNNAVFS